MLFVVAVATADDMTWTCPELESPGDAEPFRDPGDVGTIDLFDDILAIVESEYDTGCPEEPAWDAGEENLVDVDCVTSSGTRLNGTLGTRWTYDSSNEEQTRIWDLEITPGEDASSSWSSLTFQGEQTWADGPSDEWNWSAAWVGELDPRWPSDGSVTASAVVAEDGSASETWDDGTCSWSTNYAASYTRTVSVAAQRLRMDVEYPCYAYVADLDGAVSIVSFWDWSSVLPDDDGDEHPDGTCDCDDTRADVNVDVEEACSTDGLDADCDGVDQPDRDADGYGDAACGGDDCDDHWASVHPGGEEIPYDGLDQDCDGADLRDVDGDGFEAGRDPGDDCDDDDPTRFPGADEVAGDGVDQDCDGADVPGPVVAVVATGSYTPPAPPAEQSDTEEPEERGCGHASVAFALLPLLGWRKRRRA